MTTPPELAPCKIELRLEPDEYAQALYLALGRTLPIRRTFWPATQRAKAWEIRSAVQAVLAEHGTRGVKKWYAAAVKDAKALDSVQPDEGHWRDHLDTWLWCRRQVHRAFKPRGPRTRRITVTPLIDILTNDAC